MKKTKNCYFFEKPDKMEKRNQMDTLGQCHISPYFSLSQISHSSVCLVAFYLTLGSDNNRVFHVHIFSSDPLRLSPPFSFIPTD